jgi:hypothetical protein
MSRPPIETKQSKADIQLKCVDSRMNMHILSLTSVPFTLTTVQVPILSLTHMNGQQ